MTSLTPNQLHTLQEALSAIALDEAWKDKIIVVPLVPTPRGNLERLVELYERYREYCVGFLDWEDGDGPEIEELKEALGL